MRSVEQNKIFYQLESENSCIFYLPYIRNFKQIEYMQVFYLIEKKNALI